MRGVSAVLPVYNEEAVIENTLREVAGALAQHADFEIIAVDDGSRDSSRSILIELQRVAPELNLRVVAHEVNQGYGAALATGFSAARHELVFMMDSDGQFDARDVKHLLGAMDAENADLVIGWRYARADPPMRLLNAWGWKLLVNRLFGYTGRDIDCAFKLFRRQVWNSTTVESRGATFSAELLIKARRAGFSVKEVPVRHLPRTRGSATGARPAVIARAFKDLLHLWWSDARQFPGSQVSYSVHGSKAEN
jgi:glycosyltransferase involved in cell wall biosynthesis